MSGRAGLGAGGARGPGVAGCTSDADVASKNLSKDCTSPEARASGDTSDVRAVFDTAHEV